MVPERVVLGRVEHLEQRRGGVAPVVGPDLVDLVQHDDRVHGPGLAQRAHQAARLGAHVGAAVATDLGLVADAAERHADELAPQCVGDGLAERRLADARRADEGQDRTGAAPVHRHEPTLGLELAHGQVLEDAFLDVGQPVVVGLEDVRRRLDVEPVLGFDAPRDLEHRVEPRADPARLGALVTRALELVDLAFDGLADVLGEVGRLELGPVVVGVLTVLVAAEPVELLADGVELAAQEELALRLLHALFDVGLDLLAQGEVGEGVPRPTEDEPQTRLDVDRLEHLDLLGQREVGRVARHVGEAARLGDVAQLGRDTAGATGVEDVLEHGAVLPRQLLRHRRGLGLGDGLGLHPEGVAGPGHAGPDGGAVVASDGDGGQPAGQLTLLHDLRDHADAGEATVDVRHEQQAPAGRAGGLHGGAGLVGLERHGEHHPRQHHP